MPPFISPTAGREVLDKDIFEAFEHSGLLNRETAGKFRKAILEKGFTVPPMQQFTDFMGEKAEHGRHAPQKTANLLNASGKPPFAALSLSSSRQGTTYYTFVQLFLFIHYNNVTYISHRRGHIFALTFGKKEAALCDLPHFPAIQFVNNHAFIYVQQAFDDCRHNHSPVLSGDNFKFL